MAGRSNAAPTFIVEPAELMTPEEIRADIVAYDVLGFPTPFRCAQWLAKRRLLANSKVCCNTPMSLVQRGRLSDGVWWKCRLCGHTASLRTGSFFSMSRLSLTTLVKIIYGWTRDYPQKDIAYEARLGENSWHTIVDWCSFCRDVCDQHLADNPNVIGGFDEDSSSIVVEIDESKFFHREHHRGQWREGHWVFGGVERESGKCFLVEVPNRTAETLFEIIQAYILPGSTIMSDGWRAYGSINQIGGGIYDHQVVIHQENFVDPDDRTVHTQNVENMWMRAKRKLKRQFGTSEALFVSYLHEFVWRNKFKNSNTFAEFVLCARQQYPL